MERANSATVSTSFSMRVRKGLHWRCRTQMTKETMAITSCCSNGFSASRAKLWQKIGMFKVIAGKAETGLGKLARITCRLNSILAPNSNEPKAL